MSHHPELVFWFAVFKIAFGFALIIGIHEFGHALCAWLCGVKVQRFSIGMGPGVTFRNVPIVNELVVSPLVIGGYVIVDNVAIEGKSFWKRMLFYSGGMIANVITAAVLFALSGSNFFIALWKCFLIWLTAWPGFVWMLASHQITGSQVADSTMGPIGIGKLMLGDHYHYLVALALINVFVAVTNLLPLPPLDGGFILRAVLEKIVGKKWAMRVWKTLLVIGLPALFAIFLFATTHDLNNIFHPHK